MRHQNGLPREVVDALSLQTSSVRLDGSRSDMVLADCRGAGLDGL